MNRYKILDKRKWVEEGEIDKLKDFDQVLSRHKTHLRAKKDRSFYFKSSAAILIIISLMVLLNHLFLTKENSDEIHHAIKDSVNISITPIAPKVMEETEQEEIDLASKNELNKANPEPERNKPIIKPEKQDKAKPPIQAEKEEYTYIEAEPIKGIEYLYQYFDESLQYPEEGIADSISGVTLVTFVIDTLGHPIDVYVVKSLGKPFDIEAERLIQNMPEWRPATINGKPVNSKLSIPLTFQFQK